MHRLHHRFQKSKHMAVRVNLLPQMNNENASPCNNLSLNQKSRLIPSQAAWQASMLSERYSACRSIGTLLIAHQKTRVTLHEQALRRGHTGSDFYRR